MAETKLEEARERLGRLMTKAVVAGGYPADDEDQSNDAHLGREFIRSRADLRLILAELDRRSPPTREASPIIERLESIAHHFESSGYAHGQHVDKARAAREAARMIAALAAAPPPPDGEVEQKYSSLRSAPHLASGGKPPLDEPESAAGAWRPMTTAPRQFDETTRIPKERTGLSHDIVFGPRIVVAVDSLDYPGEDSDFVKVAWCIGPLGEGWWDLEGEEPFDRDILGWMPLPPAPADTGRGEDTNRTNPDPCAEDEA